jgi:hypothetical protein
MGQSTFRSLFRAAGPACLLFWAVVAVVSPAHAGARQSVAEQTDAVLYRVFLRDGGMLVSYGEFAHMGDRVVLSIPIGGTNSSPVLHLVTIQSADVDWDRAVAFRVGAGREHAGGGPSGAAAPVSRFPGTRGLRARRRAKDDRFG